MADRVARIAGHVLSPSPTASAPWPPEPPARPFAGFESPSGKEYPPGTAASLMGNMEPVTKESAGELVLIHGSLPSSLDGQFIRNGPNPALCQDGNAMYHEFEGDAMLHAVSLRDGHGTYMNRYVRTRRFEAEAKKGGRLSKGEYMTPTGEFLGSANTALVHHAKRLLALYEVDKPYALSAPDLETLEQVTYDGQLKHGMTAHPKVCPDTGELVFFNYAMMQPVVHYAVADKSGRLLRDFKVPTKSKRMVMMHDMAITKNYSVLLEFPLFLDMAAIQAKSTMPYVHDKSSSSWFGVLPRHAESAKEVKWFEAKTGYCFHILNSWEDGDCITIVGCRMGFFSFEYGKSEPSRLYEWKLDLRSGTTVERQLDTAHIEFPVVGARVMGKRCRFGWAAMFAGPGVPLHSICGCVKYDLQTGEKREHKFLDGRWGGESVFAPTGEGEDEGYLLTYTYNPRDHTTELYVVDAKTMDPNPVAILRTPSRVPFGFHGLWLPRDEM